MIPDHVYNSDDATKKGKEKAHIKVAKVSLCWPLAPFGNVHWSEPYHSNNVYLHFSLVTFFIGIKLITLIMFVALCSFEHCKY